MGEYYNLNAVETVADPENITSFRVSGDLQGVYNRQSATRYQQGNNTSGSRYDYSSFVNRWILYNRDDSSSTEYWRADQQTDYPWEVTSWTNTWDEGSTAPNNFRDFVGGSIISKFGSNVTRPVGLSPNTGSVTDYFCYYKTWTGQADGGSSNNETVSLGDFGTWTVVKNNAGSDSIDADLIFVRKSDRKAIQVTGDLFTPGSITVTDITNVNYPELQRLRYLGYA